MSKKLRLDKPNQLINVIPKEEINLLQQKCYNVFLKTAQNEVSYTNEEIREDKRYIFTISAKELEKKAGLNMRNYKYIKEEMKKLSSIVIEIVDQDKKNHWKIIHLLDHIEREGDKFKYVLNPIIVKALQDYTYFTKLDLLQVAKLESKYSVILYEMAKRYHSENKNVKIPKINIEKFRKITNTQDKYKQFYNLRKRVLDTACKEISKKTDIILDYKTEKTGRKITHIQLNAHKKRKHENIEKKTKRL